MAGVPQRQEKVIVLSPKDRRRTKLAAAIERVALSLFVKQGFSAVTVDEIADAADISKRTFFRYFASKEDLLLGDRQRYDDSLANAVAKQRPGQSAVTMLREILVEMSREIEADADISRLRLELFRRYPETMSGAFEQQKAWNSTLTKVVAERMGVDDSRDMRPALIVGGERHRLHWRRASRSRGRKLLLQRANTGQVRVQARLVVARKTGLECADVTLNEVQHAPAVS